MPKHVQVIFYHVLGGFIARYGFIDSLVASMCQILFENMGGHPDFVSAPQRFTKRREFILKCYAVDPRLSPDEPALVNIFKTLDGVDDYRHFIVHGCHTDYFPEKEAHQFTRVDARDDRKGYQQISITVTHRVLTEVTQAGTQIVKGLVPIGDRLQKIGCGPPEGTPTAVGLPVISL